MVAQKKFLYIVSAVINEVRIQNGDSVRLDWIDGQMGVAPVFTNRRMALKYVKDFEGSVLRVEARPQDFDLLQNTKVRK